MIRGLYAAATAVDGASLHHDVVAQNLANASTPGYRRIGTRVQTFDDELKQATQPGAPALKGARLSEVYSSFEPGPLQSTGNRFHVAIVGNAFFAVDGPEGTLLTRNGSFVLGEDNELQTVSGYPVKGQGGGITIPPQTGNVTIGGDGRVLADNVAIDQLKLVKVDDPTQLERAGPTYFKGDAFNDEPGPGEARVEQGFLESSNVKVVDEMVSMLIGLRQYQAANRVLRSIGETLSQATRPDR